VLRTRGEIELADFHSKVGRAFEFRHCYYSLKTHYHLGPAYASIGLLSMRLWPQKVLHCLYQLDYRQLEQIRLQHSLLFALNVASQSQGLSVAEDFGLPEVH
jgi:hypothetical protein